MSVVGAALPRGAVRTSYAGLAAVEVPVAGAPTVLLVPGFTGSKEDFSPLLPHLPGLRLVAVDLPGQHESPGPDDPAAYTVPELAARVLAVAEAVGAGALHLVGHSFGGLVARAAVLARPAGFVDLTLMASGPSALSGPRAELMGLLRPLLEQGGMPAVVDAMDALDQADPDREPVPDELRAFLRARFVASSPTGLLAMGEALLGEPDRVGELAATGLPTLVLHGEADDAWSPALQADMARRLDAAYEVVPGAGHSPAAEAAQPTAELLLRFWRGQLDRDRSGRPRPSSVVVDEGAG